MYGCFQRLERALTDVSFLKKRRLLVYTKACSLEDATAGCVTLRCLDLRACFAINCNNGVISAPPRALALTDVLDTCRQLRVEKGDCKRGEVDAKVI